MVDLQNRVQELQDEVAKLKEDKEQLYKDLENMLLQNDASFWSGSAVLYERIALAEDQLLQAGKEKERLGKQVVGLKEDLGQMRELKRVAEDVSKGEVEKNIVLERELAFYKQRGAHWIEDRNLHLYEVEELKRTNVDIERKLTEIKAALENEKEMREVVEHKLGESNRKVAQLQDQLVECTRIPELESKLIQSKDETQRLTKVVEDLELELKARQSEIHASQDELDESSKSNIELENKLKAVEEDANKRSTEYCKKIAQLEEELSTHKNELRMNSDNLAKADESIFAAKAQAQFAVHEKEMELEEARAAYEQRIANLKLELKSKDAEIERQQAESQEITQAKLEALLKCEKAQGEVNELKSKLGKPLSQNGSKPVQQVEANGSRQPNKNWW